MKRSCVWPVTPGCSAVQSGSGLLALAAALAVVRPGGAEPPRVRFDVTPRVACRDVTPPEFAKANPDERLVEAKFQVSSLIHSGREDQLLQYLYFLESPHKTFQVVDFLPKTTLAAEVAGNVGVEEKKERLIHFGLTLSGQYQMLRGSGGGDADMKTDSSVRYELLPPKELLAASGTVDRGAGVYFKLKPSRQTSLEGAKEFVVVLRTPKRWRADEAVLQCTATGEAPAAPLLPPQQLRCGQARFLVALYLEGDEQAKAAAERLNRAELALRRTAAAHRDEIARRCYPTVVYKVGAALDVLPPRIPDQWLERVIFGPDEAARSIVARLPDPVREAAEAYWRAKTTLRRLNGAADAAPGAGSSGSGAAAAAPTS